jgi:hypothetical protein
VHAAPTWTKKARRRARVAALIPCSLAALAVPAGSMRAVPTIPVSCSFDQQAIVSAERQYFLTHHRYGTLRDLRFGRDRPTHVTVELWPDGRVYLFLPVAGKGCEPGSSTAQHFAAKAAMFCTGVQQAVFDLQTVVLNGRDVPDSVPPEKLAEFYRRGAGLLRELKKHLLTLHEPAALATRWRAALKAFDSYGLALDDAAHHPPSDLLTDRTLYERHQADYQTFVSTWAPLVNELGSELQACQYIGFQPSSGR